MANQKRAVKLWYILYIVFYCSVVKILYRFKKASASINQLDLKYKFHSQKTVRLTDFHSLEKQYHQQKVTATTTDQNLKTTPYFIYFQELKLN